MAVSQQPGKMLVAPVQGTRQWETGLLDCCSDIKSSEYMKTVSARCKKVNTLKILKFGTPQTIAIIVLKIEKFDVTLH